MKIRYNYKVYKDYPEATEISKIRGILRTFYSIFLGLGMFFSIACLIEKFSSSWYIGIPIIVLCVIGFWYLITGYEKATERMIVNAIGKENKLRQKAIDEEYVCLYIYRLNNHKSGHCTKCLKNSENLLECALKDRYGEDITYLCNSCIGRYNKNKK